MALDVIIQDGDKVQFLPQCGGAIVAVKPGTITASGKTTLKGKKVCVEGDESSVEVAGCNYLAPPFVVPGTGTLTIKKLVPGQLAQKVTSGNKALILKGQMFIAEFKVDSQAKMPPPANTPDPVPMYIGQGQFMPANNKIKAS